MVKMIRRKSMAIVLALAMVMGLLPALSLLASAAVGLDKIYYTEAQQVGEDNTTYYRVRKANLSDGLSPQTLYDDAVGTPDGVAVDAVNGYVYFSDPHTSVAKIYRYNLSTSSMDVLISNVYANDLAIDTVRNKIYFTESEALGTDYTHYRLMSAKLSDGSALTQLYYDEVGTPKGVAVDAANGYVYFSDPFASVGKIYRCGLDGTNRIELVSGAYANDVAIPTADTTAPTVAFTSLNSTGKVVTLTFSEALDATTAIADNFTGTAGTPTVAYTTGATTLTLTYGTAIAAGSGKTIIVGAGVKDVAGNAITPVTFTEGTTSGFTGLDTTAPSSPTYSPANSTTGVAVSVTPTLGFSEALYSDASATAMGATPTGVIKVYEGTSNLGTALTEESTADNSRFTVAYNATSHVFTVSFGADLKYNQSYYVELQANKIYDAAGNPIDTAEGVSFKTIAIAPTLTTTGVSTFTATTATLGGEVTAPAARRLPSEEWCILQPT